MGNHKSVNGQIKMQPPYKAAAEDDMNGPVDPVAQSADQGALDPVLPIGSQFLGGLHDYHTKSAQFFNDNITALEPELVNHFRPLEKGIMSNIQQTAAMHNERYPDLPPLDGSDWTDPDADGDDDSPGSKEDKSNDSDDIDTGDPVENDNLDGERDAGIDKSDMDDGPADDSVDDEKEVVNKKIPKAFREAVGNKIKAFLAASEARRQRAEEARKKVAGEDAIKVVKEAARLMRSLADDVRVAKDVRGKAKAMRANLLKTLPKIEEASQKALAPVVPSIDVEAIVNHLKGVSQEVKDPAMKLWEEFVSLKNIVGK
jgi:hypothetical protein